MFNIQIKFRNSSSQYFSDAIKMAKKFDNFIASENKKELNKIEISYEEFKLKPSYFQSLWELVRSWKGTEIELNNKPISSAELSNINDVIKCNVGYNRAVIQETYCKINDEKEGWGCKLLNSIDRSLVSGYKSNKFNCLECTSTIFL